MIPNLAFSCVDAFNAYSIWFDVVFIHCAMKPVLSVDTVLHTVPADIF